MGYSEFSSTDYSQWDMHEFIELYKRLVDNYAGTLQRITDTNNRLTAYEENVNARIKHITEVVVPGAVDSAVATAIAQYGQRVTTLEGYVNVLQADVNTLKNSTVELNAKIDLVKSNMEANIANEVEILEGKISALENATQQAIDLLRSDITAQLGLIQADMIVRDEATFQRGKRYTDEQIKDIQKKIDDIDMELDKASIRWVWQMGCCFGGYSAVQWYNETPITAQMWHDMHFNAVDWYVRGREVFGWFHRRDHMFSPVSGRWMSVKDCLYELCQKLKINGITAKEYDDRAITAGEYEMFQLLADEYDWNGWRETYVQQTN